MINNEIKLNNDFNKCKELLRKLNKVNDVRESLSFVRAYDDSTEGRVLGWDLNADKELAKEFNRLIIEYVMAAEEN
jgi:hypothetical protein